MDSIREVNVQEIMAQIREDIAKKRRNSPPPSLSSDDLLLLHSNYDITRLTFTSHRKWLGRPVVLVKKVLRRLLMPILERQVMVNAANARLATQLQQQLGRLGEEFREEVERLREQLGHRLGEELRGELEHLREQLGRTERKVRRLDLYTMEGPGISVPSQREATRLTRQDIEPEFDYAGFEERFRGSEQEIKERQRKYVEHFRGAAEILDVGCGRGEFLELLREAGIKARGVDSNLDMVLLCKEKGLDVIRADGFQHLDALPDESLGGIFAAQFIEHFPPYEIIRFVRLCQSKLKPDGALVLETPNPECLTIFASTFYLDFSHVWPCHPEAVQYLLETVGFKDIRVEFSAPVDSNVRMPVARDASVFGEETERFNRAAQFLNHVIFGHRDYAILGRRI